MSLFDNVAGVSGNNAHISMHCFKMIEQARDNGWDYLVDAISFTHKELGSPLSHVVGLDTFVALGQATNTNTVSAPLKGPAPGVGSTRLA